jgi:hypothetical protein
MGKKTAGGEKSANGTAEGDDAVAAKDLLVGPRRSMFRRPRAQSHLRHSLGLSVTSTLFLSLTPMSEYDFRPGGSLKLKRTTEDGEKRKCVFITPLPI